MKPFLGIDRTTDKHNETLNVEKFLVQKPSPALSEALERSQEAFEETIDQSKLPLGLRIGKAACGVVGAAVVLGIAKAILEDEEITLSTVYRNASWLIWLGVACLVVYVILEILSKRKEKEMLSADESQQTLDDMDRIHDSIFAELAVPPDAKEVDILNFFYKVKNGEIKVQENSAVIAPYFNPIVRIFADSENLYLANMDGKYAFPLSGLKAITTVKKKIRVESWNKEDDLDSEKYRQYKLTTDEYDCFYCKSYHILELDLSGEQWGIWFPCYELPAFEQLTGLTATENA